MSEHFEDLIKRALQGSRVLDNPSGKCLSEEDFSCFLERQLGPDTEAKREHIVSCTACRQTLKDCMLIMKDASGGKSIPVPESVTERAKALVSEEVGSNILDIVIAMGKDVVELVRATGEVLIGGNLVPVPVLRSRQREQGQEEVRVVKDLSSIIADVQIEKSKTPSVDMAIRITDKVTKQKAKGIRVALLRGGRELESLSTVDGKAAFQELKAGSYKILLSKDDEKLGIVTISLTEGK